MERSASQKSQVSSVSALDIAEIDTILRLTNTDFGEFHLLTTMMRQETLEELDELTLRNIQWHLRKIWADEIE